MVAKVLGLMRVCLCMGSQQMTSERRLVTPTIRFTFLPNNTRNIVLASYSTMFFTFHLTISLLHLVKEKVSI